MNKHHYLFILLLLFTVACEDTVSDSNHTNTQENDQPKTEDPKTPEDDRPIVYLQGLYASTSAPSKGVYNIFDNNESSYWQSSRGTGPDEGIMLYFLNKLELTGIEIEGVNAAGLATLKQVTVYGNGAPIAGAGTGERMELDDSFWSIYIRVVRTDKDKTEERKDGKKFVTITRFPDKYAVAIKAIRLFGKDGEELRIVPPEKIDARITASSTLEPQTAYGVSQLFDARKELAWVEGAKSAGVGERISFTSTKALSINAVKIWNGYQRSDNHFEANAKVKDFELQIKDGVTKKYTLRNTQAPQKIDLSNRITTTSFDLEIKDIYKGHSYQDLGISELLFFDDEKPIVFNNTASKNAIDFRTQSKNTVLEPILNKRLYNENELDDIYTNQSIILRADGTFVLYANEYSPPDDSIETIADGNWEILEADDQKATIKIFGKYLNFSELELYYKGKSKGDVARIFKDELTITAQKITGKKLMDEVYIK